MTATRTVARPITVEAVGLLVVGVVVTGLAIVDVVLSPGTPAVWNGQLAVATLVIWSAASLAVFGLFARAAARRVGGPRFAVVAAVRDALWATALVAVGCVVPLTVRTLGQHPSPPEPVAAWLDVPQVFGLAVALATAAGILTVVTSRIPEHR